MLLEVHNHHASWRNKTRREAFLCYRRFTLSAFHRCSFSFSDMKFLTDHISFRLTDFVRGGCIVAILLGFAPFAGISAQTLCDSTQIWYRQSHSAIDPDMDSNRASLDRMNSWIDSVSLPDSALRLKTVRVVGAASPEGSLRFNRELSERRAQSIFNYFSSRTSLPDSLTRFDFVGRDWSGLARLVENDPNVPSRAKVQEIIRNIVEAGPTDAAADNRGLSQLKHLDGGRPYRYMYSRLFPSLRFSRLYMEFEQTSRPAPQVIAPAPELPAPIVVAVVQEDSLPEVADIRPQVCRPFYMGLKTNLLYDALALPSLGAEFYVGKNWSVGINGTYGWWDRDRSHRYWRAYGADLNVRRWFGAKAAEKPLTGHHLGLYAGVLTYDFEFGHTGYMGGKPGGDLIDRCNYFGGVEYGYSLPIGRRLNIDFTIGLGYMGGKYVKYEPCPSGNEYVWRSTHRLSWFGPTKAEISLVWLIGCDNFNRNK